MNRLIRPALFALLLVAPAMAHAQQAPAHFAEAFLPKFTYSAERLVALAEATPAELFSWRPGEGTMTMEHVYMHIAHYNYMYPVENMGAAAPAGLDMSAIEAITGKEAVLETLRASIAFTQALAESMTAEELAASTTLYGQSTQKWDVLFQLQSHLSEHMGQLIAYARMNDIVPPWSR
ncbi:MAG: DinB family protein [Rhodothermales bacterium]|nr:DinB family protein [Rhodothermales bacterium]